MRSRLSVSLSLSYALWPRKKFLSTATGVEGIRKCITIVFPAPRNLRVWDPVGEAGEELEQERGDTHACISKVLCRRTWNAEKTVWWGSGIREQYRSVWKRWQITPSLSLICAVSEPLCLQQNGWGRVNTRETRAPPPESYPTPEIRRAEHQSSEDFSLVPLKSPLQ